MTSTSEQLQQRFDTLVSGLKGPVPAGVLRNFLFGPLDSSNGMPANDKTPPERIFHYTPEQIERPLFVAETNLERIKKLPKGNRLICCGGGPGCGKTTALLKKLEHDFNVTGLTAEDWADPTMKKVIDRMFISGNAVPAAMSAPDRKGLLQLALHDFDGELFDREGNPLVNEAYYLGNRAATNFLSLFEFDAGFTHGTDIVWDTTLGSPGAVNNLQYAKDQGYRIEALLQGAPLDTREAAANTRNARYSSPCPRM